MSKVTTSVPGTEWKVVGVGCSLGHHRGGCIPIDCSQKLPDGTWNPSWPIFIGKLAVWCSCDCHAPERDGDQLALDL